MQWPGGVLGGLRETSSVFVPTQNTKGLFHPPLLCVHNGPPHVTTKALFTQDKNDIAPPGDHKHTLTGGPYGRTDGLDRARAERTVENVLLSGDISLRVAGD